MAFPPLNCQQLHQIKSISAQAQQPIYHTLRMWTGVIIFDHIGEASKPPYFSYEPNSTTSVFQLQRPSSYRTQVSLVIKALNTQNGSFKYLLRKVWTIGDTNGVIISLNHLEKKVLFWKRLSSLFLQLFSSSDRFRKLASIETGEKILNGWRRHPCSGGNCCAGGEKQV